MAFPRRPRTYRRRPYRSKRTFRRKSFRRIPKKAKFSVAKSLGYKGFHCFKESASGQLTITGSPASPNSPDVQEIKINSQTYSTWRFNLNQVSDWRNYQNLFQQFRVTGVAIRIFPAHNSSSFLTNTTYSDTTPAVTGTAVATTRPIPSIVYKVDPNDVVDPSTFNSLLEKDPKYMTLDRVRKIYLKPKLTMVQAEGTALSESHLVNTNSVKWANLDKLEAAPSTLYDYHGLDMGTMGCEGSVTMQFVITYYFQCKTQT